MCTARMTCACCDQKYRPSRPLGPLTSQSSIHMVGRRYGDQLLKPRVRPRIRLRLVGAVTLTCWVAASLFLTVTPVFALSATCGTVTLSQGTVSPANGTPVTTFTFTVTYKNSTGGTPNRARVRFGDFSQIVLTGSGHTQA